MRRTKAQAAETRAQILKSAERHFLAKGYENVKLEDIAADAGVTRGAIKWHFSSKQSILFSLRDETRLPFQQLLDNLSSGPQCAALPLLQEAVTDMFGMMSADPRARGLLKAMLYLDLSHNDEEEDCFRTDIHAIFMEIFEQAKKRGDLARPWTAKAAATALAASINGLIAEWALEKSDFLLAPDGQEIISMIFEGWRQR
ncbi:TetR family transcriptional regulator [Rhizobium panacihumi]|uniref:TetR family transcriptional regulator n=1 Tax=Rhizobium panacihumi TaxID=2008450 RepID=UPI003D7B218C